MEGSMKKVRYLLLLWAVVVSCLGGCQDRDLKKEEQEEKPVEEKDFDENNSDNNDSAPEEISAWRESMGQTELKNPIESIRKDTWYDYGTGDPYVMRYNGTYYLYMSTRDTHAGVKCFSSGDLATWHYEGFCTEEPVTKGAYAPEVVYYNGMFYMYTSPAGNGHYVLSSSSPTGPFQVISDNLGFSIDGSVFIDHNGKWYFYHASDDGIVAHEMSAPNQISPIKIMVNAFMDGWTEGPMVVFHDGTYFLTYTGNHVFSKGYRINYGAGDSPEKFNPGENNPVLVHALNDPVGIGHSSTVKGPDLDSYYLVYHTLTGHAVEGMPKREMNIDRIIFHGDTMKVLGPTTTAQQAPKMPFIYAYFEVKEDLEGWNCKNASVTGQGLSIKDGSILSEKQLADQFTAEYHVRGSSASGRFGGIFGYQDENNYGRFCLSKDRQSVVIELVEQGEKTEKEFELKGSFGENIDFSALQAFQIEKLKEQYVLYFNDRLVGKFTSGLSGGKIGYFSEDGDAFFGFIGGSNDSGGSGACTYEKPVPGIVDGISYKESSTRLETVNGEKNTESILLKEGDYADYKIRIAESGMYDFRIFYAADQQAEYQIFIDGKPIAEEILHSTEAATSYKTSCLRGIALSEGSAVLRIQAKKGEIAVSEFALSKSEAVKDLMLTYDSILDDYIYFDGKWRIKDGALILNEEASSTGKRLYGSEHWGDYTVKAEFKFLDKTMDAGVLIRASNPALGGAGNSVSAGTYFLQGYYVGLQKERLILAKINYSMEVLKEVQVTVVKDQNYNLEVSAVGTKLTVSLDGQVLMEYEDSARPFLNGAAGVRCYFSPTQIDMFSVTKEN